MSFAEIKQAVADAYDLSVADLEGPCRKRRVAWPRQVAMLLGWEAGFTYRQIGNWLGGRDHSTVVHGVVAARHRSPRYPHYPHIADTANRAIVENGAGTRANASRPLVLNPPAAEVSQTMHVVYRAQSGVQALSVAHG